MPMTSINIHKYGIWKCPMKLAFFREPFLFLSFDFHNILSNLCSQTCENIPPQQPRFL